MKTALIFGITGQDGSYLAELLLEKHYRVVGVSRRSSTPNNSRIRHLAEKENFLVVPGDVTDASSVSRIIEHFRPDEIYNLSAQSHVKVSFDEPQHTTDVTYKGCLNILEAIRAIEERAPAGTKRIRFYQASSSEMFGSACSAYDGLDYGDKPDHVGNRHDFATMPKKNSFWYEEFFQDEYTPFLPNSPYAIAKLAAHHACRLYRESYGLFACSGILMNHESPRRGEDFVTRKITKYVSRLAKARLTNTPIEPLALGNLEAKRDWSHAKDMVRGMHMMLQQAEPDDYLLATGETHKVSDFLLAALRLIGVKDTEVADCYNIDPSLFRPSEVPYLRGDASKAKHLLGWKPTISFDELVCEMVYADIALAHGEDFLKKYFLELER